LAQVWCRAQLEQTSASSRQAAELICQLSEIQTDWALTAPFGQGKQHWRSADATLTEFLQQQPQHPARLLVRLQQALNTAMQGEVEQLRAASRGGDRLDEPIRTLRLAAKRLDEIADRIEQYRQATDQTPAVFSKREFASLANRVALRQAETNLLLAGCHAEQSPDRDDALLAAAIAARELTARSLPERLRWQARLTLVETLRKLGKTEEATASLAKWQGEQPPPEFAARHSAEQWRLVQLKSGAAQGTQFLAAVPPAVRESPEVEIALLEDAVRRWRVASGIQKQTLNATIGEQVARVRSRHSGLWALRAEAISSDMLAEPVADGSIEALATSAERLYRLGRTSAAVDAYDRAAAVAYQSGARGRAFELALAAAAIRQSLEQWADASKRYRRAALTSSTHADAPTAHRLAVVCLSQALRHPASNATQDSLAPLWKAYFDLLEEHLATWPNSATASELRWWLADALTARQEWLRLAALMFQTPATDPRYGHSQTRLADAWSRRVSKVALLNDAARTKAAVAKAVDQLQPQILGASRRWPASWSDPQRHVAIELARLRIAYGKTAGDAEYAVRLMRAAIAGEPPAKEGWLKGASTLLAAGQIRLDDWQAAGKTLRRAPPASQAQALPLLHALREAMDAGAEQRQLAGELTLSVLDGLEPADSGRAEDWRLPFRTAALEAIGAGTDALDAARQLVQQQPSNAAAQIQLARLLSAAPDKESRLEALGLWRTIEHRSGRGDRRWFDARLARIRLLVALGQREQAIKLLKLTRVLHPKLGGMQREFDAAEQSLAQ